jgi:hypothetical protein
MLGIKSHSFSCRRSQGRDSAGFLLPKYGSSKAMRGARTLIYRKAPQIQWLGGEIKYVG